jgi:hypothetical protein
LLANAPPCGPPGYAAILTPEHQPVAAVAVVALLIAIRDADATTNATKLTLTFFIDIDILLGLIELRSVEA